MGFCLIFNMTTSVKSDHTYQNVRDNTVGIMQGQEKYLSSENNDHWPQFCKVAQNRLNC